MQCCHICLRNCISVVRPPSMGHMQPQNGVKGALSIAHCSWLSAAARRRCSSVLRCAVLCSSGGRFGPLRGGLGLARLSPGVALVAGMLQAGGPRSGTLHRGPGDAVESCQRFSCQPACSQQVSASIWTISRQTVHHSLTLVATHWCCTCMPWLHNVSHAACIQSTSLNIHLDNQ